MRAGSAEFIGNPTVALFMPYHVAIFTLGRHATDVRLSGDGYRRRSRGAIAMIVLSSRAAARLNEVLVDSGVGPIYLAINDRHLAISVINNAGR